MDIVIGKRNWYNRYKYKGVEKMKNRVSEIPFTLEEVRELMRQEKSKRGLWLGIAIGVVLALVGVVIWVARKKEKDLEEHYEYFDDDYDELDEDYDEFDDSIYDENDDEKVEYVKINDFMNYEEDEKTEKEEVEE